MNESIYSGGVLTERIVDHGDGTGTRTVYENGVEVISETVTRPLPDPGEAILRDLHARLAALVADLATARAQISQGQGALATINATAQVSVANLASLQALQTQVKTLATVQNGNLTLLEGLMVRTVALARIVVADVSTPAPSED